MSTPLDYAEFYFDHVDKGESMKAPAEGVAAMSTPRPQCKCHCTNCCTSTLRHCGIEPCNVGGVAAPLEPSPEQFIESRLVPPLLHGDEAHQEWLRGELRKWIPDLKLWAAAVSKNLREELTASQLKVRKYKRYFCDKDTCSPLLDSCESETTCCLPCHLDTAEARIVELEKEIAALMETKL